MFIEDDFQTAPDSDLPSIGRVYGAVDFDGIRDAIPDWMLLEEVPEDWTPGAIKQEDEDDVPEFIKNLPEDAFTDKATVRVIQLNPDKNPTKVVDREYLLSDKSDLIKDSAELLKHVLHSLMPTIFAAQPNLTRIEVGDVDEDGHVNSGRVIWTVELSASNQPGIYRTQQSTPLRKSRVEIPIVVKDGLLVRPMVMVTASNKLFPLTVEGCQLLLGWKSKPVVKKGPPRVELSWQPERDYRAF
jgi:hypothetical protein